MSAAVSKPELARMPSMLSAQVLANWLLLWRNPAISVVGMALPLILFSLFAAPAATRPYSPGVSLGAYSLASFGAYGVGLTMVFLFGASVAIDRGQKNDLLMLATPLPPLLDILARTLVALAFAMASLLALLVLAVVSGVHLDPWRAALTGGVLLLGGLPFLALGLAIAYLMAPNAATATGNLLYMVLCFASGIFVPLSQLPGLVREVAPYLPTFHYAQLALGAVGAPSEAPATSVAWLLGYGVVLYGIALWAYRREALRRLG